MLLDVRKFPLPSCDGYESLPEGLQLRSPYHHASPLGLIDVGIPQHSGYLDSGPERADVGAPSINEGTAFGFPRPVAPESDVTKRKIAHAVSSAVNMIHVKSEKDLDHLSETAQFLLEGDLVGIDACLQPPVNIQICFDYTRPAKNFVFHIGDTFEQHALAELRSDVREKLEDPAVRKVSLFSRTEKKKVRLLEAFFKHGIASQLQEVEGSTSFYKSLKEVGLASGKHLRCTMRDQWGVENQVKWTRQDFGAWHAVRLYQAQQLGLERKTKPKPSPSSRENPEEKKAGHPCPGKKLPILLKKLLPRQMMDNDLINKVAEVYGPNGRRFQGIVSFPCFESPHPLAGIEFKGELRTKIKVAQKEAEQKALDGLELHLRNPSAKIAQGASGMQRSLISRHDA
mmetsp:Transcript_13893/g.37825  ORF Transcript_13893/g.37825 Transcript_13893/m.37825 type:complete len:399 (-) Transcript_13893:161-1357(-)|eukprot:CAMPEP_0117503104 /NCGR_PEP_ID=MMETSP0784-20121206/24154_1 /TAXON_ID=39447 /ORGANISM="" /LENGTH=398 /DNA_ID=CAMNT_0005298403 /DNA_START=41 /DNA_END=1237 /DNA_ORIENTATION=+